MKLDIVSAFGDQYSAFTETNPEVASFYRTINHSPDIPVNLTGSRLSTVFFDGFQSFLSEFPNYPINGKTISELVSSADISNIQLVDSEMTKIFESSQGWTVPGSLAEHEELYKKIATSVEGVEDMYRTIVLNHLNNRFQNQSVTPVGLMTQVRDNIVVVFGNPADSNGHGNYAFYQYPIDSTESCREGIDQSNMVLPISTISLGTPIITKGQGNHEYTEQYEAICG